MKKITENFPVGDVITLETMTPPARSRLADLFDAHAPAMVLYARHWLDRAGAEDAVQEVFMRLLSQKSDRPPPLPWLFRYVRNEAMSLARSGKRRRRRQRSAARANPNLFHHGHEDRIDAAAAQAAMATLSPPLREVLILRLWSGLTHAQIAQVTGLAQSTIHQRYRAALAGVRTEMESTCKTPTP